MRTLRRQIIIRENEYMDLVTKFVKTGLYDRGDFEPLTYKNLRNDNLIRALQEKPIPEKTTLPDLEREMEVRKDSLYNPQYLKWTLSMDFPEGQVWVRSRDRYSKQRLVIATFEKDL